jgi:hypothetical protein
VIGQVRTSPPQAPESQEEAYARSAAQRLVAASKKRARESGIPFSLDWRDVYLHIFTGTCQLTGLSFESRWAGPGTNPYAPSIDRIDSRKGYTRDNVRLVLWAINRARGEWDDSVLLRVATAFVTNSGV